MQFTSVPPSTGPKPLLLASSLERLTVSATSSTSVKAAFVPRTPSAFYPPDPKLDITTRPWVRPEQIPTVLINASVVDTRNLTVRKGQTLHLAQGKIISITPTSEDDVRNDFFSPAGVKARKIDCAGFWVCPGLIDCHVHLMTVHGGATLHAAKAFPHEESLFRSMGVMRGILANGFTTVRDVGGAGLAHAKASEEWLVPGPRVFQGGRMLSQTGGHGDTSPVWLSNGGCCSDGISEGNLGRTVDGVTECLKATRELMRQGANHVKVCAGGGIGSETDKLESLQFTYNELVAICETVDQMSNGESIVTAHVYTKKGILAGVRGIEHGNFIDQETAALMVQKKVFFTPALALHTFVTMPPFDKFETPEGLRKNKLIGGAGLKAIQYAEEEGVVVCYGTDTTGPTLSVQTYEFVVRASVLSSPVVLRQATLNGAKQVNQEGLLGEIVVGAYADLIFLAANPLEDVTILDRPNENLLTVIKDGRVVKSQLKNVAVEVACDW